MLKNILEKIMNEKCWLRRRLSPLEAKECLKRLSLRAVSYLAGFTLIEMLAIVIIIGILTSIAIPNYSRAVEKTKRAEAHTTLRALYEAQEVYYLEYKNYTNSINKLDVNITNPGKYFVYTAVAGDPSIFDGTRVTGGAVRFGSGWPTYLLYINEFGNISQTQYGP